LHSFISIYRWLTLISQSITAGSLDKLNPHLGKQMPTMGFYCHRKRVIASRLDLGYDNESGKNRARGKRLVQVFDDIG
jgi:hypothetical protein